MVSTNELVSACSSFRNYGDTLVREGAKELQLKEYILTRLTLNKGLPRIYAQAYCDFDWSAKRSLFEAVKKSK